MTTTKDQLLDVGDDLFLHRGFTATGIQDILKAAGVPKGSFYHHFGSKEEFALQVVERYAADGVALLEKDLADPSRPHLERLRTFFAQMVEDLSCSECRGGCLMGTLGHELANLSEPIRQRVDALFRRWTSRMAECLEKARDAGEIDFDGDPEALAEFCFLAWEGALQQMKIQRHATPLRTFLDVTFERVLKAA